MAASTNFHKFPRCLISTRCGRKVSFEPYPSGDIETAARSSPSHVDPKVGLNLYGPRSFGTSRHRSEIHFAFIGTGESIETVARFYTSCAAGVSAEDYHEPFPGCDQHTGFRTDLKIDTSASEIISEHGLIDIKSRNSGKARFEATLDLLNEKVRLLKLQERPIDHVVLAYWLCQKIYMNYAADTPARH